MSELSRSGRRGWQHRSSLKGHSANSSDPAGFGCGSGFGYRYRDHLVDLDAWIAGIQAWPLEGSLWEQHRLTGTDLDVTRRER